MLTQSENRNTAGERLSALMDGELEGAALARACAQWREDPRARADWHAYHLIGDVLRSDDLACDAGRDAVFLQAVRARLAREPVVLAPSAPAVAPRPLVSRFRSWRTPTAVAAGFVAVAGALTLTRPGAPSAPAMPQSVAQVAPMVPADERSGAAGTALVAAAGAAAEPAPPVASGQFVRDARLDRYLAAHKQFAGSSALGVPSAYLRNATAEAPGR